jgi:hypothetical protein
MREIDKKKKKNQRMGEHKPREKRGERKREKVLENERKKKD